MFNDTYLNQRGPQLNLENINESYSGIYKCLSYNAVTMRYNSASSAIQIMGKMFLFVSLVPFNILKCAILWIRTTQIENKVNSTFILV